MEMETAMPPTLVLWDSLDSVQQLNYHRIYLGKHCRNSTDLQFENKSLLLTLQDIFCGTEN